MADFVITGWEHDLLNRIYEYIGDAPFPVSRLAEAIDRDPDPARRLIRKLVVAGWLREYKPLEGEAAKPRRFQVSDRRVPEKRPPWVVFLMGAELGDPIQYASCHKVRVATSDPDKAFYFSSEQAARRYVAGATERFEGLKPRVVNFDHPTLVPGKAS